MQGLVRVITARLHHLLKLRIAERGHGGVVYLKITAARRVQRVHFLLVGVDDVAPEQVEIGISSLANGGAAAGEVQNDGRGNGDFGSVRGDGAKELEVLRVNGLAPLRGPRKKPQYSPCALPRRRVRGHKNRYRSPRGEIRRR